MSNKYVVDASVVLDWLDEMPVSVASFEIYKKLTLAQIELVAPKYLWLEVLNVLVSKKKIPSQQILEIMDMIVDSGIVFEDVAPEEYKSLLPFMYDNKLAAYDALYMHLAKQKGIQLITLDKAMLRSNDHAIEPSFVE